MQSSGALPAGMPLVFPPAIVDTPSQVGREEVL